MSMTDLFLIVILSLQVVFEENTCTIRVPVNEYFPSVIKVGRSILSSYRNKILKICQTIFYQLDQFIFYLFLMKKIIFFSDRLWWKTGQPAVSLRHSLGNFPNFCQDSTFQFFSISVKTMECSRNFLKSKLPELPQFSTEASWRWTQFASWRRMWQNVGSRCLSTTMTDISSTTGFGGTQNNFSQTDSLTLADTPMLSISTRRTFRNYGNSCNSKTRSWKQLKMPSPSPKPISNQTQATLCLLAFTAGF